MMFEGHPLFSMENIHRAYRQCRRHKRGTMNAMRFERNLEENLVALHEELNAGTYKPGRSIAFLIDKPKRREIFAADFRDRVVHHILVGHLEPKWERRFIHDSYACRRGKGTHAGVERVQSFTRKVTANGTRRAWYLQLDVRGFFITLDKQVLWERIARKERDPAVLWLAQTLIFHDPVSNCHLRDACRGDFERLPPHKTLFKAGPECGLPIGNLTSQFFANVYLDALDQLVKHELKARYYVRYCDDVVLLSEDRGELEAWEQNIEAFVEGELRLRLNQRRKLRPVADGIDFLGYVVRPDYMLVRRRVVTALRERLEAVDARLRAMGMTRHADGREVFVWHWPLIEKVEQWLNSYLGHFERASTRRLVCALRRQFGWLDEFFLWRDEKPTSRCPVPRKAVRLCDQRSWFTRHLPGHAIVIRLGMYWELLAGPIRERAETWETMSLLSSRFPQRDLRLAKRLLWDAAIPVAWVQETGQRTTGIAERAVTCRREPGEAALST